MNFGLHANTRIPDGTGFDVLYEEILEEALWAEKYGFSVLAIDEHHRSADGYFSSPMLALAGIATRTKSIQLLPSIVIIPLHNPVQIAEEAATLDIISRGRLILGAGQGSVITEYWGYGVDWKARGPRLSEGIGIIERCWQEDEPFSYQGKFIKLDKALVTPKPVQKPRPPIWIAATKPKSARRAAKLGDKWLAPNLRPLQELQKVSASYVEAAKEFGKVPSVALMRDGYIADGNTSGMEEWAKHVRYTYLWYYKKGILMEPWIKSEDDLTFERLQEDRFIIGDPGQCIEKIERFGKAMPAVDTLILRIRQPGMSHENTLQAIRLFGEKVIPYFVNQESS